MGLRPRLVPEPDAFAGACWWIGDLESASAHATTAHATHATTHTAHATTHTAHHSATHPTTHATTHATTSHPHRDDEIGNRIDLDDHVFGSLLLRGDQHHLVFDEIGEVDLTEEETQR